MKIVFVAIGLTTATLLDDAVKRFDLQRAGSAPIELRARVLATDLQGDSHEGNYHLLWLSPTAWLEEIAFPTFWEVSGRTGKRSWRKRKLEFSPDPVRLLRETVHFAKRMEREAGWTAEPSTKTCIKVHADESSWRRWCFESKSRDLLREDAESGLDWGSTIEYYDWRVAEGKRFPGRVVYSVAKRKRLELSVREFSKPQEIDPAKFEPPQGAEEDPVCESLQLPQPSSKKTGAPRGMRGEATLEFRVAVDGSVRRLQIASATSPQFGRAVAELASKMKFRPALCDGRPVEMPYVFRQAVR